MKFSAFKCTLLRRDVPRPLQKATRFRAAPCLSLGEGIPPRPSAAQHALRAAKDSIPKNLPQRACCRGFRLHAARQTTRLSRGRGLDSTETAAKGVLPAPPPQSTRCRTRGNVRAHCVVAPSCALRACYPSGVARSRACVDRRLNCHRRASYVPCASYANPPRSQRVTPFTRWKKPRISTLLDVL